MVSVLPFVNVVGSLACSHCCQDKAVKYAASIIKYDRSTYNARQRVLVAMTTAIYVLDDQLKLHNRIPYEALQVR